MDKDIDKIEQLRKLFEMIRPKDENKLIKELLNEYGYNTTNKSEQEKRLFDLQNDILKSFNLKTINY